MIVAPEFPLNRREAFRAEITDRGGVLVVSIGRWKIGQDGTSRRAGPPLELAGHRLEGIIKLIADVQRLVEAHQKELDCSPDVGRVTA
jgi:hypothetical protein